MRVVSFRVLVCFLMVRVALALPPTQELEDAVRTYWEALIAQDKVTALGFVHPEDRNNFLNRPEPLRQSFELIQIDRPSEMEAFVQVQVTQLVAGQSLAAAVEERWERTESGWRIRIPSFRETLEKSMAAFGTNQPKLPPDVSLSPPVLKIYRIARPMIGMIALRNGLRATAEIRSLELDSEIFQIVRLPSQIRPGTFEWIRVAYKGTEKQENLESQAVLKFEVDGEPRTLEIPILYNYQDEASRWLTEGAQKQLQEHRKQGPQNTPPQPPGSPH